MDIMQAGMGFFSGVSIFVMFVELIKQILTVFLLFKGIQVANVYLKNNIIDKNHENDENLENDEIK